MKRGREKKREREKEREIERKRRREREKREKKRYLIDIRPYIFRELCRGPALNRVAKELSGQQKH